MARFLALTWRLTRKAGSGVLAATVWAATAVADSPLPDRLARALARDIPVGQPFTVVGIELDGGEAADLDLERFQVFAPGALVIHRDDDGRGQAPPCTTRRPQSRRRSRRSR